MRSEPFERVGIYLLMESKMRALMIELIILTLLKHYELSLPKNTVDFKMSITLYLKFH